MICSLLRSTTSFDELSALPDRSLPLLITPISALIADRPICSPEPVTSIWFAVRVKFTSMLSDVNVGMNALCMTVFPVVASTANGTSGKIFPFASKRVVSCEPCGSNPNWFALIMNFDSPVVLANAPNPETTRCPVVALTT